MIKKFKETIKKNGRKISRIVLIVICASLVIGFMPKVKEARYDFKIGSNWAHENLIAEFDFKVYKTPLEINAEERSLYKPCFEKIDVLSKSQTNKLRAQFLPDQKLLKRLYTDYHIIADEDTIHLPNGRTQQSYVYEENRAKEQKILKFITTSEAKQLMSGKITDQTILDCIEPNYRFNPVATEAENRKNPAINPILEEIKEGAVIINNSKEVTARSARIIETYLAEKNLRGKNRSEHNWLYVLTGQSIFIVICLVLLLAYITLYKKEILNNTNKFIFTLTATTIFPVIVGIMTEHGGFNVFILPFAIIPITLCLFVDYNTAFVANTISLVMCSIMVTAPYEFLLLQLTASYCAILTLRDLSSRSQMFKCVTITLLTYSVIYLCYEVVSSASFTSIDSTMYIYFIISSILTLFVYPLMFIIERTFGFISSITLIELSNLNCKLLQRLSQETPGTFQHAMQVGNLAAEAAIAVGGNPLEARTGALYHDIGKLENPIYFTENQSGGISPHSKLTPIESAQTIIKHVTNGLAIAEKENLPKKIKEFIATHHGLSKTGYFYITYKNAHPNEVIDDSLFTYPGPRPFTKEQAVLMMADCVEAASHSIKEYTEENISKLVDNIIDAKFREGELMMAPLTFQDIFTIKEVFKKRLMAIYHTRISYPSEKK